MSAVLDTISHAVEKALPMTWPDRGFTCPRGGIAQDTEAWIRDADARQLRQSVVRWTSLAEYDTSLCYRRLSMAVEVSYPCSIPEDLQQQLWQEDCIAIVDAIVRHPSRWGAAEDIYPQGPASVETYEDDTGRIVLYVLVIPFSVILSAYK